MSEDVSNGGSTGSVNRRTYVKSLAGGALAVGSLSAIPEPVRADYDNPGYEWEFENSFNTLNNTHRIYTGLVLHGSTYYENDGDSYWRHDFDIASNGCSIDDDENLSGGMSQNYVSLESSDSSDLPFFTSSSPRYTSMYPEAGDKGTGDILNVATSALSLATAGMNPYVGASLGAAQLAASMANLFVKRDESGASQYWQNTYYSQESELSHNVRFIVDAYETADKSAAMDVVAKTGTAEVDFLIAFNMVDLPQAYSLGSAETDSIRLLNNKDKNYEFGDPKEMSPDEKRFFGIKQVPIEKLPERTKEIVESNTDKVFVAEKPPIQVTQVNQENQNQTDTV